VRATSASAARSSGKPLVVDQIRLRQGNDSATHAQEAEDGEVLAGLRHDSFVGRDDEERQVNTRGAGHHGSHEGLMTRHIHDADGPHPLERERRKPELNGNAPPFLLG
jgi:hypothetical protein